MKLKEARVRKLLTIRELADKAGVSASTITSAEQGHYRPRLSVVRKLSEVLDVEPADVDEFKAAIESAMQGRKRKS